MNLWLDIRRHNMKYKDIKKVLTIAGSDSSGGAGIQADIKTILANGCYAMSAITALTAQNTTGVQGIYDVPADFLEKQIDSVFTDIYPDAVKIGMVSSAALIEAICKKLINYKARNIVVDPVMVSTSKAKLLADDAADSLINKLIPLADLVTPNIPEAEVLSGISIKNSSDMEKAGMIIKERIKTSVLLKGGHSINDANDLLIYEDKLEWIRGERIDNPNTHGTGCTLSSAIAAYLAKGFSVPESVRKAKDYISGALAHGIDIGSGSGPLNHGWNI